MKKVPWLLGLLWIGLMMGADRDPQAPLWTTLDKEPAQTGSDRETMGSFRLLIERSAPAVVAIHTLYKEGMPPDSESEEARPFPFNPWRLFPEIPREAREGIGSGFVIRSDGYVVTNQHVVANSSSILVRVEGLGNAFPAQVIGSDSRSDIALIKIDPPKPLPCLPLGDSDELPVGAWVVAIGNPFGLTAVATKGIVSGKGRTLENLANFRIGYLDFIQTDAAIDLGNSGGPLLNLEGEVIGVNTAINSRARGIGFAVPIDLAKAVLEHLYKRGRVVPAYLGISVDSVKWELAESFGMAVPRGVLVTKVLPDTPAAKAGIQIGDVILKFNQKSVQGRSDMNWRAATAWAGKAIEVEIFRKGQTEVVQLTPEERSQEKPSEPKSEEQERAHSHRLGLMVVNLDSATIAKTDFPKSTQGVIVVGVEDDAALYGVRVGDMITTVNDKNIANQKEFEAALSAIKPGQMIRFYILRQRGALYVALPKRWE